jgi:hypothetical protein
MRRGAGKESLMKQLWIGLLVVLGSASPTLGVNVYNVSDYASPQAAIDAAKTAGGGLVHFPCGTTTLSQGLVVDAAGITLEGCGPKGTVLTASFATGNIIALGNSTTAFSPCGGVRDLMINSSVSRTSGYAIAVNGCEQGILENLRIATQGGHGIRFSNGSNGLASIFSVRAVDIEIQGAFTAIQIDGANDRFFKDLWLRGSSTAGSRGIVITESGGDWFGDVESVQFEIGVEIAPSSGHIVAWSNFQNVLADTNTLYGFSFSGTGSILGLSCMRCWAATNGINTVNGRGMRIARGSGLTFTDSRVINNGGHGVEVTSTPTDIAFSGGIFTGNCVASGCTNGLAHGIVFDGTSGFRIEGTRAGQAAGQGNKQGYGIFLNTGCNNYIVTGNDTRINLLGGINNVPGVGATRIVTNNL